MSGSNKVSLDSADPKMEGTRLSVALSIGSALLDHVHPEYRAASQRISIRENTTVHDVVDLIGLSTQGSLLIVLNDSLVTRPQLNSQRMANGDELAFMSPIHAG